MQPNALQVFDAEDTLPDLPHGDSGDAERKARSLPDT
jgi:hypothetical protein